MSLKIATGFPENFGVGGSSKDRFYSPPAPRFPRAEKFTEGFISLSFLQTPLFHRAYKKRADVFWKNR